jgi:MFS family permease
MKEFTEGFIYLKKTPSIGIVLLFIAFVSLLVLPFTTLLPVYAKVIFKGNASTYGYLNSLIGLGALVGAIFLASLKTGANLKNILVVNLLILGVALALFSHITNFPIALFFAMMSGFAMMSQTTISNTIIQIGSSAEMRGRALSFFAMAFFGLQPLGGLLIGIVSQYIGTPNTILAQGIAAILIAVIFLPLLRKEMLNEKDKKTLVELEDTSVVIE